MIRRFLLLLVLLALFAVYTQAQARTDQTAGDFVAPVVPQAAPIAVGPSAPVGALTSATADNPHYFTANDFGFVDFDGDRLQSVIIKTLPNLGTLRVGAANVVIGANNTVAMMAIATLNYYPPSGQSPQSNYASFTFSVTAGDEESNIAAVRIDLRATAQVAATGMPDIASVRSGLLNAAHYDKDEELFGLAIFNGITNLQVQRSSIIQNGGATAFASAALGAISDHNGIGSSISWQWQQSATSDGTYAPVSGANPVRVTTTINRITPRQAQVGKYIRACVTFNDLHATSNSETLCSASARIVDGGERPAGGDSTVSVPDNANAASPHRFAAADFPFSDTGGDTINGIRIISLPSRGTLAVAGDTNVTIAVGTELSQAQLNALAYYPDAYASPEPGYATFTYRVHDSGSDDATNTATGDSTLTIDLAPTTTEQVAASGRPDFTGGATQGQTLSAAIGTVRDANGINRDTIAWQWYQAPTDADVFPPTGDFVPIADAAEAELVLTQAQVGHLVRVCISFTDTHSAPNPEGPLCSIIFFIQNINDAPTGDDTIVMVPAAAAAASPHNFERGDFPFMDIDGDDLAGIRIASLPTGGTLVVAGDASVTIAVGTDLTLAHLDALAWYPHDNATPGNGYDSFTYWVRDDMGGSASIAQDASTLTIDLISATPTAAGGQPAISGAATQGQTLSAAIGTVRDANGLNPATLRWQWYAAAPDDGSAPAADSSAWAAIADATAAAFIPAQAQVGMHIRVCAFFMDSHATSPAAEGGTVVAPTLCSAASAQVANVNDAPMTEDSEVSVPATATAMMPYAFKASDFPFADEDGDSLQSITITGMPTKGALRAGTTIITASNVPYEASDIPELNYYPEVTETEVEAERNYASFRFTVSDGMASSAPATMSIHLGADLRLRLRIFLEGPLR